MAFSYRSVPEFAGPRWDGAARPNPSTRPGELPASAPGTAESMAGPFYPPGVLPVRPRRCRWLAVPRGSADGKTMPARGRGPEPQSSGRGVITLRKERCCLRSSTVGGRGPSRPPGYVRRSEDRLCELRSPRLAPRCPSHLQSGDDVFQFLAEGGPDEAVPYW